MLEQSDLDQEIMYEELKEKKKAQDHALEKIKTQLKVGMLQFSCMY